jgi:hypothetical protein
MSTVVSIKIVIGDDKSIRLSLPGNHLKLRLARLEHLLHVRMTQLAVEAEIDMILKLLDRLHPMFLGYQFQLKKRPPVAYAMRHHSCRVNHRHLPPVPIKCV